MEKENESQLLSKDSFWEENGEFFGIKAETPDDTSVEAVVKAVKTDKEIEEEEETTEVDKDVTFFEETKKDSKKENVKASEENKENEEEEEEEEETPFSSEESEQKFFKTLAIGLKEAGILSNVEIEDDDINGDKFADLIDKETEARINETFESFFEELDEDGAAFLKFKKAGGKTSDFLKAYSASIELPIVDLNSADGQKKILRYYYKHIDGTDEEDIDDKIEWAIENGKLEKYAEKYSKIIQNKDKENKDRLLLQQETIQNQMEEDRRNFEAELKNTLEETDSINNITLSKEDKKDLIPFMTKPLIKIGKNKYITGLQAGIQKIFNDKTKLLLLAKLVKSDFDFSTIEKKGASKLTKEVKNELQRQRGTPSTKTVNNSSRELADYFK